MFQTGLGCSISSAPPLSQPRKVECKGRPHRIEPHACGAEANALKLEETHSSFRLKENYSMRVPNISKYLHVPVNHEYVLRGCTSVAWAMSQFLQLWKRSSSSTQGRMAFCLSRVCQPSVETLPAPPLRRRDFDLHQVNLSI